MGPVQLATAQAYKAALNNQGVSANPYTDQYLSSIWLAAYNSF